MKQDTKIAKIPASAGLNLDSLTLSEIGNFYDCQTYDATLRICQLLFGGRNVQYDYNKIIVRDSINITLSLSNNETKIYFDTHILPTDQAPEMEFIKANNSFRLFSLNSIFNYLLIKRQENEFIKENEG